MVDQAVQAFASARRPQLLKGDGHVHGLGEVDGQLLDQLAEAVAIAHVGQAIVGEALAGGRGRTWWVIGARLWFRLDTHRHGGIFGCEADFNKHPRSRWLSFSFSCSLARSHTPSVDDESLDNGSDGELFSRFQATLRARSTEYRTLQTATDSIETNPTMDGTYPLWPPHSRTPALRAAYL